ncbi:hypothetical protein LEP1GSC073_2235 [Leptospira noguchii str. Cascata]|nr:hypothetical protein LEP1GSC073_2873 [Leptospira noguchii str. Cascata]EMS88989.1 hypothetical protein LEP1GSC073_2235 [Leptospira noguchii str. Cascata]
MRNSEGIGAKRTTQRLASMVARSKLSVSLPELSKTLFTKAF